MRSDDLTAVGVLAGTAAVFAFVPGMTEGFISVTTGFPYLSSFVKFAVLATFGECVGLRITCGAYNRPGFGILPKALVWGLLGLGIKAVFTVFAVGTPVFLAELGLPVDSGTLGNGPFHLRLLTAFAVSLALNCIFAPVMMILHKMSDNHISASGGTLRGFFSPFSTADALCAVNWDTMWNFVLKKTIPFFWIPAHTVTFLLPAHFQVLFAAALGVSLGAILSVASVKAARQATQCPGRTST